MRVEKAYSPVVEARGDSGGRWVAHDKVVELRNEMLNIHEICKLKEVIESRGLEELKHFVTGKGVERTNRH